MYTDCAYRRSEEFGLVTEIYGAPENNWYDMERRSMKFSRLLKLSSVSTFLALGLFVSMAGKVPTLQAIGESTSNHIAAIHATIPTTLTLEPAKDNSIFESNTNSGGASPVLVAGKTSHEGVRRALVAFDLSQLPTTTTVLSVTLRLQVEKPADPTALPFGLHRVASDWGEAGSSGSKGQGAPAQTGDATWAFSFYTATQWSSAGGDFVTTASAITNVGGSGSYEWSSPQLLSDVQGWIANPSSNFGWILVGDETTNRSVKLFVSNEGTPSNQRPQLIITYEQTESPSSSLYLPLVQR